MIEITHCEQGSFLLRFSELERYVIYESEGNPDCLYVKTSPTELIFFRIDGSSFGTVPYSDNRSFKPAGKGTRIVIKN